MAVPPIRYKPVAPVCLMAYQTSTERSIQLTDYPEVGHAIYEFARLHLPPVNDRQVAVVDSDMQIILGYGSDESGYTVEWAGVESCFDMLAGIYPVEEVTLYEAVARGRLPNRLIDLLEDADG